MKWITWTGDCVKLTGEQTITGAKTFSDDVTIAVTKGLYFGDGDTGIYESADDVLRIKVNGNIRWYIDDTWIKCNSTTGWWGRFDAPSSTVPNIGARADDSNTGIGQSAADQMSLICGGNEILDLETGISTFRNDLAISSSDARLRLHDTDGGDEWDIRNDAGTFGIRDASTGEVNIEVWDNNTAGETRLKLWDVDNNTLETVSVGSADSGGVGFKVLRIPN